MIANSSRRFLVAALVTALSLAWVSPIRAQATKLIFSSGPTGGSWTPLAAATAETVRRAYPEIEIYVEPGGSLVNMEKIMQGKAQLGWTMSTAMAEALARKGRWTDKPVDQIRYVASFFPNIWQLATPENSGIRTAADLKGKAVALPPRAAASLDYGWLPLLQAYGLSLDQVGTKSYGSITENVEMLKNRQAVAMGWLTTVPASFMLDLVSSQKLRLVPVSEEAIAQLTAINPGFARYVIPKGTYSGIDEDVVTFQASTSLIVSASVSPDVVYKITKSVIENSANFANVSSAMKSMTREDMAHNFGIPLHPGAERYYREVGFLK